jgi:drug/metabolite transporter (DMT)-like permease
MSGWQVGELAAVATAILWTLSTVAWTSAGQRIGSLAVCFLRLLVTCLFLSAYGGLVRNRWLPTDADAQTWWLLGLSGLAGFFLADVCSFRALLLIGPRLTLLVLSLTPPTAAVLSWIFLQEQLTLRHWLAMGITLTGITWVVLERSGRLDAPQPARHRGWGLLLAVAGAVSGASGMVLARRGIGDYDAAAATYIRVLGSLPGYFVLLTLLRRWPAVLGAVRHTRAMTVLVAGSFVGPFLGVILCMVALRSCPTGIVTTIVSTMPVLVLPFSMYLYRERVSPRAIAGAIISVLGVGLMCWGDPG